MSSVRTLVSTIETGQRAEQRLPSPGAPRPEMRLSALGRDDGTQLRLPPRQVEILTLLALEPDGFSLNQLREALYGSRPVASSTFKAEVSHLRRALDGRIATRTYMLTAPVTCDAIEVLRALGRGEGDTAVRRYRGPLLPHSEAPGIVEWREYLEVTVREAVLSSSPEHALRYGERAPYDGEIHEHALRLLTPGDARRAIAASRLAAALRD
ncbi:hypothetical protein [Streptomyces sp. NPDC056165]|uniref:hypothetical protein n=1 Tax=Streptomyces sp. NPDC056165 TaxID=3345733 RepID=UPI0035D6B206